MISVPWASQVALVVKNPPANSGDIREAGLIPGSGRSPGGGYGNPLQYSCLENPHGQRSLEVTQSWTRLKRLSTQASVFPGDGLRWPSGRSLARIIVQNRVTSTIVVTGGPPATPGAGRRGIQSYGLLQCEQGLGFTALARL